MTVLDPNKQPISLRTDSQGRLMVVGTGGGGGTLTDLSLGSVTTETVTINNSNGSGVTLPGAGANTAGLLSRDFWRKVNDMLSASDLTAAFAAKLDKTAKAVSAALADTATKLATAVRINGVLFDGTADITAPDSTKVAKAGDTLSGTLSYAGTNNRIGTQWAMLGTTKWFVGIDGATDADSLLFSHNGATRLALRPTGVMSVVTTTNTSAGNSDFSAVTASVPGGGNSTAFRATGFGDGLGFGIQTTLSAAAAGGLGWHLACYGSSGTQNGGIYQSGASAISFNTTSDYRLKGDVIPVANGTAIIKALRPVNFKWLADGSYTDGFLAHEAQGVVPYAVTGKKDDAIEVQVYSDAGKLLGTKIVPKYQSMDHSKLVPVLVAALQDALARIEALEARNAG